MDMGQEYMAGGMGKCRVEKALGRMSLMLAWLRTPTPALRSTLTPAWHVTLTLAWRMTLTPAPRPTLTLT